MSAAENGKAGPDSPVQAMSGPAFGLVDYAVLALAGALCGGLLWLLADSDAVSESLKLPLAALALSLAAGFGLFWSRRSMTLRLGFIIALALLLTVLTWDGHGGKASDADAALVFWALIGAPLLGFLLSALARASLREHRLIWPYRVLWQAGASILADGLMALFVGLASVIFVALWGVAFKAFGMEHAAAIIHHGAFLAPLGGAAALMAAGLARTNARLGEAVRNVLLIGCRIGLPLAAVFSVLFTAGLIAGGLKGLQNVPLTPAGVLLALALMTALLFNGVYQDGAKPPPRWLRVPAWLALAALPVYVLAAAAALWMRVQAYGLTPLRMIALIALILMSLYTVLLLAGLASELFARRLSRWMPPVARLNTAMALVWVATLILLRTPVLDPLAWSANNQAARLLNGKASAADFDFGFLRFALGKPGRKALDRLAQQDDPAIKAGIARAKAAKSYYDYKANAALAQQRVKTASPADKALVQLNAVLAPTGLVMNDAAQFDYGALAYGDSAAGKAAWKALQDWLAETDSAQDAQVRSLRAQVHQGVLAATLAKSLQGWRSAQKAAGTFTKDFERDAQERGHAAALLSGMAGEDRAVRALFKDRTRLDGNPDAAAMLNLLRAGAYVDAMDRRHLERLKELLDGKPWFAPLEIDLATEQDAWLIVLHGEHDPEFQAAVLKALRPRAEAGLFDGRRYALLYDTWARAQGKPQRYGTQLVCRHGRWVADDIAAPKGLAARRAKMHLKPLRQVLKAKNARSRGCQG